MTEFHLIRPPYNCISWKQILGPPPNPVPPQKMPKAVNWLFSAFLFFDRFPHNSPNFDGELWGNLSNAISDFPFPDAQKARIGKEIIILSKSGWLPYTARAPPPLLTF